MARLIAGLIGILSLFVSIEGFPHEGPPYPVLVDQRVDYVTLSVWADPDIGTGTFYVVFDPPLRDANSAVQLSVVVQPKDQATQPARSKAKLRSDGTYVAEVTFDRSGLWRTWVEIHTAGGKAQVSFDIQPTPPGYGTWELLIYGAPFLLLGSLWVAVFVRHKSGFGRTNVARSHHQPAALDRGTAEELDSTSAGHSPRAGYSRRVHDH